MSDPANPFEIATVGENGRKNIFLVAGTFEVDKHAALREAMFFSVSETCSCLGSRSLGFRLPRGLEPRA